MKNLLAVCAIAVLAVASAAGACHKDEDVANPAAATSGELKEVSMVGFLTDSYCGATNANKGGKGCAIDCIKKGAKLQLYADKKLYTLEKVSSPEAYLGGEVKVTGMLDEASGVITVKSIEATKKG